MRKYLMNVTVLSSIVAAVRLVRESQKGPRDWRLALMWAGWAITVALAMGAVSRQADQEKGNIES